MTIESLLETCIIAGMKVETIITIHTVDYEQAIIVRNKLSAMTNADNLTVGCNPAIGYYVRYKQMQ
jgi:hypothetical protein